MGAGHGHHRLYVPASSPVHRLPAHVKLVTVTLFAFVVVSTPIRHGWAFAGYAGLLLATAVVSRVPLGTLARRIVVEVPFVLFAVLLPFVIQGGRIDVAGLQLSVSGLWAAANVLVKATLGVVGMLLLAATTQLRDLVAGLDRLRVPTLVVQIMTFMIRYADVVTDELRRMHVARVSRGFDAVSVRHVPVLARSVAALFIRSFERGERVHLAMLSRGYVGRMPLTSATATPADWGLTLALPGVAAALALLTWVVR